MNKNSIFSILTSTALLTSCATASAQTDFHGKVNLYNGMALTQCLLAYQYNLPAVQGIGFTELGNVTDGMIFNQSADFVTSDQYALIGLLRTADGQDHVVFTFGDSSLPAVQDQSFETVFGSTGMTENGLIALLDQYARDGGGTPTLTSFYSAMCDGSVKPAPVFQHGNLMSFSNGVQIGDIQSVPEPGALLALGVSAFGLILRRKR